MEKKIIYQIDSLYRDTFRVTGFEFGEGKKSVCIVGNTRGNEYQQIYTCAKLVQKLKQLENAGKIKEGHKILVIPSANPYSANVKKRFWPTDNTDINRMFPGYDLGETTQRIAAGVFEEIKEQLHCKPTDAEAACAYNPAMVKPSQSHAQRPLFYDKIASASFDCVVNAACPKKSLIRRVRDKLKRVLR